MTLIGRTFRVFVSSTFSDLKAERDHLQEHVFPRLRDLCQQHGCRFQPIDLRWGVSEEAALDQQTMNICVEELRRCQSTTPRPNFIVLLGQRYGWCPLPTQIPAAEFEELLGVVDSVDDRVLLCCPDPPATPQPGIHWYRRDDNADPSEYVLRPRKVILPEGASKEDRVLTRNREADEWRQLESRMRRILLTAVERLGWSDHDPRRAKYEQSATHQEIEAGALSPALDRPDEHVFCFLREMADLPRDRSAAGFIDLDEHEQFDGESAGRLQQLKTQLKDRLREKSGEHDGNVYVYPATWTGTGPTADHLPTLGDDVYERLKGVILEQVERLDRARDDPENHAHQIFGDTRIDVFEGRDDLLERIRAYVEGPDTHPLVLHGVSGCGKTALIAKATANCTKKVICRFIGATPASTYLRSLLEDLCRQIGPGEGVLPSEIRELGQELAWRLEQVTAEQPLVIVLDALDQLGESDGARALWWLPTNLPTNARLVVSVLESEGSSGECYRAVTGRVPEGNRVSVGPLAASDGQRILAQWLGHAGRRLQAEQQTDVITKFSAPGNGLPLYLKLAFEEARRWTSYDGLPRNSDAEPGLGAGVQHILRDLLSRLARDEHHGALFIDRALGYLAAGRQGLTEDELVDVLSQDEDVLQNFQERSPNSPTVNRLPFIVWSRLRAEVEPYLTERQADNTTVLNFYHRQVRDAVEAWCLDGEDGIRTHRELARYFHGQDSFLESLEEQRLRAKRFPPTARPVNVRKADELFWQRLRGEQWDEVATLVTDLFFLEAKTEAGLVFDLSRDYAECLHVCPAHDPRRRNIRLLEQAIRRDIHFIARHPSTLFQCLWNSAWWYDCPDAAKHYDPPDNGWPPEGPPWEETGLRLYQLIESWRAAKEGTIPSFQWIRSLRPPVICLGEAQRAVFRGHQEGVTCVAYSPDGKRIASGAGNRFLRYGGHDNTVRVWDAASGEEIACFRDHSECVNSVAFSPDGQRIASAARTVRVWDAASAKQLAWLRGYRLSVYGIAFSPDGSRIVTGMEDGTIRIWDATSGVELACLHGHTDPVWAVAFSPDGQHIGSGAGGAKGSVDNTIRVWDAISGTQLICFRGHELAVQSVAFSFNGLHIVGGSRDGTIRVWDVISGAELVCLGPYSVWVNSVAFSPDGQRIIAGFSDRTIRLWNAANGAELFSLKGHDESVSSVSFAPNGQQVVSGSTDKTVRLWDAVGSARQARLHEHETRIHSVAFPADGQYIATGPYLHDRGASCVILVWRTATGTQVAALRGHKDTVDCLSFSPHGQHLASGSWDGWIGIWDVASADQLAWLLGDVHGVRGISFSPDGHRLASAGRGGTVCVWNMSGAKTVCQRSHNASVESVVFSADGTHVAAGAMDGTIWIWDATSGAQLMSFRDPDPVNRIAFSPDRRCIFSAHEPSDRLCVKCWDVATSTCLEVIEGRTWEIAVEHRNPLWQASLRGVETVIESTTSRSPVAWFPATPDGNVNPGILAHPGGRTWGVADVNHLYIITLEDGQKTQR